MVLFIHDFMASLGCSFDEIAAAYEEARPGYPDPLFDRIVAYAGLTEQSRLLEIGTGTAKATVPLARRGFRIVGLEPGPRLAAIARSRLAGFALAELRSSSFEDFREPPGSYDLIFAAQSFHWLDATSRLAHCAELLARAGALAVFGTYSDISDDPSYEGITEAYAKHAKELYRYEPAREWYGGPGAPLTAELRANGFVDIAYESFPWQRTFSSAQYCAVLRTYSHHRALPAERLEPLLEEIAASIEDNGGRIGVAYRTGLFLARTRSE